MIESKHRPDVDGLRAVAVALVLLFHAGLGFSGGFVGVDVFFVISGFLITGLILKEQRSGKFRMADFWIRRLRRIIPASTVMVIAVLVTGGFLLFPSDYEALGKATIAQQLMLSNFYFLRNTGYFDGPADLKPILHTWSLAVEEQFYLGYPFLLVVLQRIPKWLTAVLLLVISVASFVASEWGVQHYPSATFYLLPTRAWELLIGGLICFTPAPTRFKDWHLGLLSWLGIGGIVIAGWFFNARTPFPGLAALLPCGAAALLIYANSLRLTWIGQLLAAKPVVFVGLISYSLYLWHWPILAFLRYRFGEDLGVGMIVLALAATFVLSYLSWRFVEMPFRSRDVLTSTTSLVVSTIATVGALLLASTLVIRTDGLLARYDKATRRVFATMEQKQFRNIVSEADVVKDNLPTFGDATQSPRILVWGDSHAMALIPALDHICKERCLGGVQATRAGTLPLLGLPNKRGSAAADTFGDAVIEYVVRHEIDIVVLAGYWHRGADTNWFSPCLENTVETLLTKKCSIIIVRDVPDQKMDPGKEVINAIRKGSHLSTLGVSLHEHRTHQLSADSALIGVNRQNVSVVDPTPFFLDGDGRCRVVADGDCLYWDNDHITVAGALKLIPMFELAFDEFGLDEQGAKQ